MKLANLLPPDLVEVARVQHLICAPRALMALVLSALSLPTLGATQAITWGALVLGCEVWTWVATRCASRGFMSMRERVIYFVSGIATIPAWTTLGVLFWLSPVSGTTSIALALWGAQLIYTQRFVYQSTVAIAVGNASTVFAMLVLPFAVPRFPPAVQAPLTIAMLICVAFAISGATRTLRIVTSLAREKAAVEYGATHDALTGLLNREQMQRRLSEASAAKYPFVVLFLDLDRFKQVNDSFGHQSGDALLQEFGRRLKHAAPLSAHVARFGGDEFAVLIEAHDRSIEVAEVCRQVFEAVEAPFAISSGCVHVGVSIGVVIAPEDGSDPGELMRKADIALYAAKAGGRGKFRVFSPDLDRAVRDRADLEDDLREVLASGVGLELHYQPKIATKGPNRAVEALLRWNHPRLGDVSPTRILAVAEETSLIIPLGRWVLSEGFQFARRWPELSVAINISPAQLQEAGFTDWVQSLAASLNVEPSRIELEVTETVLLDESAHTSQTLNMLRKAGFRIALDDFGTGYSSLRHLHRFAVDRVKIDQSFVGHLESSNEAAAIVQAVIQLGHAMGLQVTAEGVETRQHQEFLSQAGVDEMQGFLFAHPCREEELAHFFATADKNQLRAA